MIDLDRTSDPELLRTAAKVLDAEVLRLHDKLKATTLALAEAAGLSEEEKQQRLAVLSEQLEQEYLGARARGGSERRRNLDKSPKEKKPQTGTGRPNNPMRHA